MGDYVDIADLQQFSIVEFLARLGHQPVRKSGKEHFYHSMLRETGKNTPSFAVWDAGGKWKDWGGPNESGIHGGGIVQLGMAYWPDLSFVEVLSKISEVCNLDTSLLPEYKPPKKYPMTSADRESGYELVGTRPIGTNAILTGYLTLRGISEVAAGYLHEVYYRRKDSPASRRPFFAIGWQNEHGGWELSDARGFKGSIGRKGLSVIPGDTRRTALFEGYFDFLSWVTISRHRVMPTVIVLNSVAMLDRAIARMEGVREIDVFFDRDKAGCNATDKLLEAVPYATDRSHQYEGFKDYNEKLKAERGSLDCSMRQASEFLSEHPTAVRKR